MQRGVYAIINRLEGGALNEIQAEVDSLADTIVILSDAIAAQFRFFRRLYGKYIRSKDDDLVGRFPIAEAEKKVPPHRCHINLPTLLFSTDRCFIIP